MRVQFNAVLKDVTRKGTKIQTDEYLTEGKFPIIDQGNNDIAGYRDDETGLFTDVPAIVFGDHTRIVKYITEPFFLGADGVKVLVPIDRTMNCKYLYYQLLSVKIPDTGYNRHFKWVKELEFQLPSRNEQDDVVKRLDKLCVVISARQQQLAKLDELVKARFVEMFGDSETNPKSWPTIPIGKTITSCESGWSGNGTQRLKKHGEIAVLKVSAVTKGIFIPEECKVLDDQENIKKYIFPQKGDLLFSRANTREMVGATAVVSEDYPEHILPDKLWRIRFNNDVTVWYMKHVLSSPSVRSKFSAVSTGTSGSMYNVSMDKFKSIVIPIPPLHRQQQFADFVEQVNRLVQVIQKSLEQMKTLKKALMQQYFG